MSSNVSTPVLEPTTAQAAAGKPSGANSSSAANGTAAAAGSTAAAATNGAAVDLDDIPPLTLGVLATREDKVDALRLVTDSIAQQRQTASRSLVFHPLNLAAFVAVSAIYYQINPLRDLGTAMTVMSGLVMTYLLAIRYSSGKYLRIAEDLQWDWIETTALDGQSTAEDTLIGARYGEEMIGALVLRLEPSPAAIAAANSALASEGGASGASSAPSRRKSHSRGSGGGGGSGSSANPLKGGRGVIRAWTTRLRYRRRGVGGDLLHEAVRVTRERCGRDAVIGFAQEHANSQMVLPEMYNRPFRSAERLAQQTLDKVLADWDGSRRKR